MTDIKDIEQRAKDMIERCQHEKAQRENAKMADKIFREPKRQAAQKEAREKAEAEQLKQLEGRWNPWIEKAMQRVSQEQEKRDKMWSQFK